MAQTSTSLNKQSKIAIVGLGYVGLPLAVEFGKKMQTIGFDLSVEKVEAYRRQFDSTGEVTTDEIRAATLLRFHTNPQVLQRLTSLLLRCQL